MAHVLLNKGLCTIAMRDLVTSFSSYWRLCLRDLAVWDPPRTCDLRLELEFDLFNVLIILPLKEYLIETIYLKWINSYTDLIKQVVDCKLEVNDERFSRKL